MNKVAVFSTDRQYRYSLWRIWDESLPLMMVVGLNGSTADENRDDPTITRLMWRAGADHFGGLQPEGKMCYSPYRKTHAGAVHVDTKVMEVF